MLAELDFVEGDFRALAWATGGAGVLMKRSLVHFVIGRRDAVLAGGGPAPLDDSRGGLMRKTSVGFAILGASVLGVLLFAPSFRQAVSVSTDSWLWVINQPSISARKTEALVEKARAELDAESLAFVALQWGDPRLADEAVALDPKLTWIYYSQAVLAVRMRPNTPEAETWVKKLVAWDPDNAAPHLLEAQLEAQRISGGNFVSLSPSQLRSDGRLMSAVQAGFNSAKCDSYFSSRLDLYRTVMARRHLTSPLLVLGALSSQPVPDWVLLERFAYLFYERGAELEKKGDLEGASREYWTVARFGQTMRLHAATDSERQGGIILQREAYQKLESVAARAGRPDVRALLGYEIELLSPRHEGFRNWGLGLNVYSWNAEAGQLSLLALLLSIILLAGWALYFAGRSISGRTAGGRLEIFFRASGLAGGLGLLASSLTIYISYHPFAALFSQFMQGSGAANADWFNAFWSFAVLHWTLADIFSGAYVWTAVLALLACVLVIAIYRVFASRGPAHQTV